MIVITLASFLFSYIIIWLFVNKFTFNVIDIPSHRSSHGESTPTGAGIVFSVIGAIFSGLFGFGPPLLCLPISLLGLFDDMKNISISFRFFMEVFISILVIYYSGITSFVHSIFPIYIFIILTFLSIIFLVGIINFTNFMDGIDGLVVGCMIIVFLVSSFHDNNFFLFPLIASLFAFLLFNWCPAKIFMGDAGSLYLGAVFGSLLLNSSTIRNAIDLLIVSSPLFADAFITLILRMVNKHNIFRPHKLHLYQRLCDAGISHSSVASIYIFSTLSIGFGLLIGGTYLCALIAMICLILTWVIGNKYAIPFREVS